jgi:hypothetical protein
VPGTTLATHPPLLSRATQGPLFLRKTFCQGLSKFEMGNGCRWKCMSKMQKNHQKKINIKINIFGKKINILLIFKSIRGVLKKSIKTIKININKKTAKFID